ncbi:hypothetical protein AU468_08405 [Alkalispirochaeta sphaeroplastigenens]|uniref:Zn-dependent protease n=1 Tax=Alkalispirochaeta sphaeroplastigenens TaxID=1187066 RepID=A0A2S4JP60_9SPIO|nr:DUF1028 domain-containing protein [Alkalispirochaeta sphaeroplastigenens]POR01329.1 hypothetical protein AU468_08405 [Alkalispirochaeta sphaeroplastigenens]
MAWTNKLAATYSIVAVDHETRTMGAAVQSHYFSVGSVVPWAQPGVGVVVTQSVVQADFGPWGLSLLGQGLAPPAVMAMLLVGDEHPQVRQLAVIAPTGESAAHTGDRCIAQAGHLREPGFSVQANMMDRPGVPEAMARAYTESRGALAERLLGALQAAEVAGGDLRGRQSAAVVIVSLDRVAPVREGRLLDLRVEDAREPLEELARLIALHRAYAAAEEGDDALARGDITGAGEAYREARRLAPENRELRFWEALGRAAAGDIPTGRRALQELAGEDPRWIELARRLPATGLIGLDEAGWATLLEQ